jgi:hypothetical protein
MKELDKPDLDLIKQENQGCGPYAKLQPVHLARGRSRVQPTRAFLLLICWRSSSDELALQ